MSNELEKRRWLFRILSANFAQFVPQHAGLFACPICGNLHKAQAVEPPVRVDLAHVYPDACGGTMETLTCKPCNSRIGSIYDGQLALEQRTHDLMTGKEGVNFKGKFRLEGVEGATIQGNITSDKDGIRFNEKPFNSNPEHIKRITDALKNTPIDKIKPVFKFTSHDPKRVSVSLLHAAYITLFHRFGYSYLFNSDTQWIRDILRAKNPPQTVPVPIVPIETEGSQIENGSTPNDVMHLPGFFFFFDGTRCLGVPFPSPVKGQAMRIVLMPGFGTEAAKDWARIMSRPSGDIASRFVTPTGGFDQEDLADPKHWDFWLQAWDIIKPSRARPNL